MSGPKALVPELRFPGFVGEWERQRLSSVLKTKGRRNTDLQFGPENVLSVSGELGVVNQIEHLGRSYAGASVAPYHVVETGDVVYTKSPLKANPFGIVKTNRGAPGIVSTLYAVYEVRDGHDPNFWDRYFELDDRTNRYLKPLVNKGAKNDMKISNERVLIDPVIAPALSEQQKIAAFLDTVSRKIALLGEKKGALEEYKRGLMQRLFSRELRFRRDDDSAFPEWQERRLGDVADIIGGGTPESDKAEYWNGDIIWFTPSEIKSKYLADSERHISESGLKNSSAKLLPVGALVLSTRATVGELGIATRPCATNQGFQSLLIRAPHCNEFWYYWVGAHKREFLRRAAGSTFLEIGKTELAKIPVEIPHPDEQRKIAAALSALDKKIDATARKISEMEAFKKGLLQKLFV